MSEQKISPGAIKQMIAATPGWGAFYGKDHYLPVVAWSLVEHPYIHAPGGYTSVEGLVVGADGVNLATSYPGFQGYVQAEEALDSFV